MRVLNCAGLAVAALLLASIASAQGLGDAAARERDKRKTGAAPKPAKVFTETDLGPASSAPVPVVAAADNAAKADGKAEAKPGEKAPSPEQAAAEAEAQAQEEWRNKLEQARVDESNFQGTVDRLQATLTDTSAIYSPGWTSAMAQMDQAKQKLAEVRARIATLEEEGRRAGYR
jgi:hypothetical protein